MPELPEVETLRRAMELRLCGKRISAVRTTSDSLVFSQGNADGFPGIFEGLVVSGAGRKGKFWWISFEGGPALMGHLGMSGWIQFPTSGEDLPKFWKLELVTEDGTRMVFTDGRRLGRLWVSPSAEEDPQVRRLGPDSFWDLPEVAVLQKTLGRRKTPIKAVLLDQSVFAGVGNYLADECLYQARIAPARIANTLTVEEVSALRKALSEVLRIAVDVEADENRFPPSWMFHHRWGGNRGPEAIDGHTIVRETVAGRTTAWVPDLQS